MSEKIENGGPAFPQTIPEYLGGYVSTTVTGGMSLRDWFAGQALAGICADGGFGLRDIADGARGGRFEAVAAYLLADAMIAARAKGGEK